MNFAKINNELNIEHAKSIVDSILNIGSCPCFVVDKSSYEIIYANDKALDLYGSFIGRTCYDCLYTREIPCFDCPFSYTRGKSVTMERHDYIFGANAKLQFSDIKWFDGREGVLVTVISENNEDNIVSINQTDNSELSVDNDRRMLDSLTRVPLYSKFYIDVERRINTERDKKFAIVAFDVDSLKSINDLYGILEGDEVLKYIGKSMRELFGNEYSYARLHSDYFAFCMSYEKKGEIIKMIEKLRKKISTFSEHHLFSVPTSYGIYLVDDTTVAVNLMCDRAMMAAKTIKDNSMKFCAFYDEQYRVDMLRVMEIEQDMIPALENGEFLMYLQPKYNIQDGSLCGAEVLCRWNHHEKGIIAPNDFIPLFERNGFILRLDEYMWEQACKTIRGWINKGIKPIPLSVNISRYHVGHNNIEKRLVELIDKYELAPDNLTLEITESLLLDNPEQLNNVISNLQNRGFKIEVDDFGSGFSSLNLIRNITVDTIKIDKDFLDNEIATEKGKIVMGHTISMAKDLKLEVIAEGVETKEHLDFLRNSKCDIAQGYFFAKPMPIEEFNKFCLQN